MSEQKLFNVEDPISAKIVRSDGDVIIAMKFPTDQQWIDRSLRRKYRERDLGRGKTIPVPNLPDQKDAALVNELQVGEVIEVNPREASKILERISQVTFQEDPYREGILFVIPFVARGARVVHSLRPPTEHESATFSEMSPPAITHGAISSYGFNLGAAGELYDKVAKSASGYEGSVPIVHKAQAISSMLSRIAEIEADEVNP